MKIVSFLLILLMIPAAGTATDPAWQTLDSLVGQWTGEGTGMGGSSRVTHEYSRVLGHFLHMKTRSVFEPVEGATEGEVHEDLGYFSFDADREMVVLRQFLSEGYVNTYALIESTGDRLVFQTESAESAGDMGARIVLDLTDADAYHMELQLASPKKDWFVCRSLDMRRATDPP
jgi:hypothetical protein